MKGLRGLSGLVVATVSMVAMLAIFIYASAWLLTAMRERAASDLDARAELAAAVLEEPLRTQDFRRLREFGDECRARGVHFSVQGPTGGVLYWNMRNSPAFEKWDISETGPYVRKTVGDYVVCVGLVGNALLLYLGALLLAVLAFLVGIAAMFFVFFGFYRQRAKLAEMSRLQRERYEFVTKFTHELKTPLTGIIAAADMMEGSRLADLVKSSAQRLDQLAQQLIYVYWGRKSDDR